MEENLMKNPSFTMLTKVYPEWQRQYEELKTELENRWNGFSKQNKLNLTYEDYQNLSFERGGIIKTGDKSELNKFDKSENGRLLKKFRDETEEFIGELSVWGFLKSTTNNVILGNIALKCDLQNIKIACKNISNSKAFTSENKSKFLLLFDAISEKYNFLAESVNEIFMGMELASNAKLQEFYFLLRNQSNFNKTFSILKDYWNGSQNLYQYITFFNIFDTFCYALANTNPVHNKECLAFLNQCREVHKSAREKYLYENIQPQQNNKPPMSTGPKEPEIE